MMAKIDLSAVEARINQSREHFDTMMIPTADAGALLDQLIQARAELEQLRAAAVGVSAALPVDLKDLPGHLAAVRCGDGRAAPAALTAWHAGRKVELCRPS
jgi:hypothetical protein